VNPSGKLPLTWPRTVGQVPLPYNRLPTGRPTLPDNRFTIRYFDESIEPLYPFGFGLSYTRFAVLDLSLAADRLSSSGTVEARFTLTNTGVRAGKAVPQLYTRQLAASRSRPLRELKAFDKLQLAPGESRSVTLQVPVNELGFHQPDGRYKVEPGTFQLWVGQDSAAELTTTFQVVGEEPTAER
jgi:beta-glucosidase